jgi:hypothetical protein
MQNDSTIKNLLQQYGIEETSSSFNNSAMQKINADVFARQQRPLVNPFILSVLKIIFLIVVVALIACVVSDPAGFSISLSNIYKQIFSFIFVFWIGMMMNIWLNKRWGSKNAFSL